MNRKLKLIRPKDRENAVELEADVKEANEEYSLEPAKVSQPTKAGCPELVGSRANLPLTAEEGRVELDGVGMGMDGRISK